MKKLIILAAIIFSYSLQAQPYLSTSLNQKSFTTAVGILASNVDLAIAYKLPFLNKEEAKILSFTIGRQLLLTNNYEDNYSITPALGFATMSYSTFDSRYNETKHKDGTAIYSLELGKDAYIGRFFVKTVYSKKLFAEIGMRVFVNR